MLLRTLLRLYALHHLFTFVSRISVFSNFKRENHVKAPQKLVQFCCQTQVQTISRSISDASKVLSSSISISDSGGLDLSRYYNCIKIFGVSQNILEYSRTFTNIPPLAKPNQTIPNYIQKLQAVKKLCTVKNLQTVKLPIANSRIF